MRTAPRFAPKAAPTNLGPRGGARPAGGRPSTTRAWRRVYVYDGPGTDRPCVDALRAQLRLLVASRRFVVTTLGPQKLRAGAWRQDAACVCMPGGRDLPYLRALGHAAVLRLRAWTLGGGRYFGSCAGAYFASSGLHFAAPRVPAVVGRRPLALFAGLAVGPSQAASSFDYAPGPASTLEAELEGGARLAVFNRGGCSFVAPAHGTWPRVARVLARAEVEALPAAAQAQAARPVAVAVRCGRGRALLWGAHPELPLPARVGEQPAQTPTGWRHSAAAPRALRVHLGRLLAER